MRSTTIAWVLSFATLTTAPLYGQPVGPVTGIVRGAEMLNVRRGPGTAHAPFARLERDQEVLVEEVVDSWARIRMENGEQGYVHIHFLEIRPEAEPITAVAGQTPTATAAEERPKVGDAQAQTVQPDDETDQLAALQVPAPPPTEEPAPPRPASGDVKADLARLLYLTEEIRREVRATARRPSESAAPLTRPPEMGPTVALAGAGLVLGLLLGSAYGRRHERNRWTRVRF